MSAPALLQEATAIKMVRLEKVVYRNFKGLKEYTFEPGPGITTVKGQNGTGKTTLADGVFWMWLEKDSIDRAGHEVKPFDPDKLGQTLHGLETSVEATFLIEDERVTFQKALTERWVTVRNAAQTQFKGNETHHSKNGVPIERKRDYEDYLAEICDPFVFRLLGDAGYFPGVLQWEKRREILLEVCGDVSDQDVFNSREDLKDIPEFLEKRTIDEHRDLTEANRKAYRQKLKDIPVRIDEITRGLPDASDLQRIDTTPLKAKLDEAKEQRSRIQGGGEIAEQKKLLAEAQAEVQQALNEIAEADRTRARESSKEYDAHQEKVEQVSRTIRTLKQQIADAEADERRLSEQREKKIAQWKAIDAETFKYSAEIVCPTCEQPLPAEQVEAARQKALEEFNMRKSERLEDVDAEGKAIRERIQGAVDRANALRPKVEEAEAQLVELKASAPPEPASSLSTDPKDVPSFVSATERVRDIEERIARLASDSSEELSEVEGRIAEAQKAVDDAAAHNARIDAATSGQKRIEELKAEEESVNQAFEESERQLHLLDEFVRQKVSLLTDKINSRFQVARFKLFHEQVNGGLAECCEVLVGGVPYNSNLNTGARVNAALDIINTLSEHYGISVPVFIDNAESVTSLTPVRGQAIQLIHDPTKAELEVETEAA